MMSLLLLLEQVVTNYLIFNPDYSIGMKEDIDTDWCNIVEPCDEANQSNMPRDVFAVRGTVTLRNGLL